ncbi:MAG: nucleotidyltransferase family protein [Myxococcaceae bacterium]|nr:nucleotidyltransferase family protein [Myxococcaceae bacterium]
MNDAHARLLELSRWLCGELAPAAWSSERRAALQLEAERHGVIGLLEPKAPAALALRARSLRALRFTLRCVAALEAERIEVVVLKGAACASLWPDPTVRPQGDVDLLVAPHALERAAKALLDAGVARARVVEGRHLHNATLTPAPGGLNIELHHGLTSHHELTVDVEHLLARRRRVVTGQGPLPALALEDDAVYLALHAATHAMMRLAWVVDLQGLHLSGVDWVEAARRARAWNAAAAVELAWRDARELLAVSIPEAAFEALGVGRARAQLTHALLELARGTGAESSTSARLLRLAMVPTVDLPKVVLRKLRANREEAQGHG